MALSLLSKPSPNRALLIARLHRTSPVSMGAARFSRGTFELSKALGFTGRPKTSSCRHGLISPSGCMKQRPFCSSSGPTNGPSQRNAENAGPMNNSYTQQGINTSSRTYPHQHQQPLHAASNNMTHMQQQQQPTYASPPAGAYNQNAQQPGYAPPGGASSVAGNQNPQPPGGTPSNMSSIGPSAGAPPPPRTSAAAEVIDKYLGPSTLKLEKRDDKAPPPPPPPRRNYGPQGTQEKKSGKDLVAESAACAVIEKYLGPWPGFPPRDPKIDEYLDSLPENAACAAIDKYFGPYKPLFVFKKNEGESNNPPPPSRPPRNRMMSRARNRAWNASQQGASVDRPWMPPQQGSPVDASQGRQAPQSAGAGAPTHTPSHAAASTPLPSQQPAGSMPSQPAVMPPHPGTSPSQMAPQQGASAMPPHGANMAPPHGAGFSPPGSSS